MENGKMISVTIVYKSVTMNVGDCEWLKLK